MGQLKYQFTHTLETFPNMDVLPTDILSWHMGPKDISQGRVKFMGKVYKSRDHLPDRMIGDRHIVDLHGRGWDRPGYRGYIKRNGTWVTLVEVDNDDWVSNDEMTWGAAGYNAYSEHIALEGGHGCRKDDDFFDHYTDAQFLELRKQHIMFLTHHREGRLIPHYLVSAKDCPGYDMQALLTEMKLGSYYGFENN